MELSAWLSVWTYSPTSSPQTQCDRAPSKDLASAADTKMPPAARWQSEEDNHMARFGETDMSPGAQKVDLAGNSVLQNPAPEMLYARDLMSSCRNQRVV